jgi:hypothetical protein
MVDLNCSVIHPKIATTRVDLTERKKKRKKTNNNIYHNKLRGSISRQQQLGVGSPPRSRLVETSSWHPPRAQTRSPSRAPSSTRAPPRSRTAPAMAEVRTVDVVVPNIKGSIR